MKNNFRLQFFSRHNLLILLIPMIFSLFTACAPVSVENAAAQPTSYSFYLSDGFISSDFVKLVPETLDVEKEQSFLHPGFYTTADGLTVDLQYDKGPQVRDEDQIWVVVIDDQANEELARFNPPEPGYISGFSADGTKILWQPDLPYNYPPPINWLILDAADGEVLAHIEDEANACFRQRAIFSPDGRTIYCAVDPALDHVGEPGPLRIAAYDVASKSLSAELEVPHVRIGGEPSSHDGVQIYEFVEPAILLTPDGTQLTVFDAAEETITFINTPHLSIDKSYSINKSVALLDIFSSNAQAKGLMDGVIANAQFNQEGSHLYLFSQELRPDPENEPLENKGLRLVDVETGAILGEGLDDYLIQWVYPAPDGTLFVFGTSEDLMMPFEIREDIPSMLWRLDGRTLEILAQKAFDGYRAGRIVYSD